MFLRPQPRDVIVIGTFGPHKGSPYKSSPALLTHNFRLHEAQGREGSSGMEGTPWWR